MIILVGKSCSGKDSVTKELTKMGYSRIVTYTTRPMRDGEIDGVEYHFISKGLFNTMVSNNEFAEWKSYETKEGEWLYGNKKCDYTQGRKIISLTPDGVKRIREEIDIPMTIIYLKVSNHAIKDRMKKRDKNLKESKRRYKADKNDFKNVENLVDYIVINENRDAFETALICRELDEIKEKHYNNKETRNIKDILF